MNSEHPLQHPPQPAVFVDNLPTKLATLQRLLKEPPRAEPGDFTPVVRRILERRDDLLRLTKDGPTPLYAYDRRSHRAALDEFSRTFGEHVPRHRPFYAVKSNHHTWVAAESVRAGFGLDVSSARELKLALDSDVDQILFSGPGKSAADLELAIAHADRVIVNLDSFRELALLADVLTRRSDTSAAGESASGVSSAETSLSDTSSAGASAAPPLRAGVRIHSSVHGQWSKFGIPLCDLPRFWREANQCPQIRLQGIQSHLSWSHNAEPHCRVIGEVARVLREQFTADERRQIRFYDFGGGYRPYRIEGRYPTELVQGELARIADEADGTTSQFAAPYYFYDSAPLVDYAKRIGGAVREQLVPLLDCEFFSEPGRVVSSFALHLVVRVVDKKQPGLVIVDGGTHMIGWERYLHVYCPVVNLTRPALSEIPVRICGSLCDPEDVLGSFCYGESIEEGDVLVLPFQGAYTFATAQNFIRDIPPVMALETNE